MMFFWRPLLSLILSIFLWISFLYLQRDIFVYSFEHFGAEFFTSMMVQLQLLSVVWIFLLGLILDLIGARAGLLAFFGGAILCCGCALMPHSSLYFSQLALQFSVAAQILLLLVILKALAIYSKGMRFCLSLAIVFSFFSVLLHFKSPLFFSHIEWVKVSHLSLILLGVSVILGGVSYFLWPSFSQERSQYDLAKFVQILRPIYQVKAWLVMLGLGILLFFSVVFFKLAVLYCFPALINIDDGYEEAVFLLGFGMMVGFFLYSLIFKNTPYLGRVVGASLVLTILCLLGIGFLSMSEELIWCLVALVGVFLGSTVLLFKLLLDVVGVEAFATACGISILLGGASYAILGATIFRQIRHLPAAHSMHAFYVHLWWVGILLLMFSAICSFLVQNTRLSLPVLKGVHVRLFNVLGGYYRGEFSLPSAFWLLSTVGRWIVICFLFWVLFFFWMPSNSIHMMQFKSAGGTENWKAIDWSTLLQSGLILSTFGILISFFLMVSVWRSGYSSLWIWRYLSRVIVVMVFLRNIILFCGIALGIYLYFHPEVLVGYLSRLH